MKPEDLIQHARRIISGGRLDEELGSAAGTLAEALEFLRIYAGEKSSFYKSLSTIDQKGRGKYVMKYVATDLEAFIRFVQNGLHQGISIERQAQIDVVSDFLEQANNLLNSKEVHPAAATMVIGAALEEFLRNWIEESGLSLGNKRASIDSYAKMLREENYITKQDAKDITSWGGLRNHAAHGEWDEVKDKSRVSLMLEGVNLFMRKYGK
ncbi:MAG: hypothetical protein C4531_11505 [Desulfurivibrio sp.]|nr:MAG: hypothetical protein C4531_11505 [Desulfurivibrio sp.]